MNPIFFFTALKLYSELFYRFINSIYAHDPGASSHIEALIGKGMDIRDNGYSLHYIMDKYTNLIIDVNGQKSEVSYEMQIYLIYVGWCAMNNYLSIHKYNPIRNTNCMSRIDVSPITFRDIVNQFLDKTKIASFFK